MHALRKNLLFRLLACFFIVLGAVSWSLTTLQEDLPPAPPSPSVSLGMQPPPPAQDQALISEAARLVLAPARGAQPWQGVNLELLAERRMMDEDPTVALVFLGQGRHYAAIDGKVYAVGDKLPDGRKVAVVNRTGVGLDSVGQRSFLAWSKPRDTLLVKQKFAGQSAAPVNQTQAPPTATQPGATGTTLSTEQAMQLIKQLNEQQQAGKKP